jgi:excisionase family DNA binding protein
LVSCCDFNLHSDMVRMKRVKMLSDSDIIASGDQYYDHREHIMNELLTVDQVASIFQVSPKTVYEWARNNLIPSVKIVSVVRFKKQDIENICKNGLPKPMAENNIPKLKPQKRVIKRPEEMIWERKREKTRV